MKMSETVCDCYKILYQESTFGKKLTRKRVRVIENAGTVP